MDTLNSTQIVILGGSGDLAKRKLIPALLDLYNNNKLPEHFSIIGLARTPRTNAEYRELVRQSILAHGHDHSQEQIKQFCTHVTYVSGSFDEPESYILLQKTLDSFSDKHTSQSNKLFYLAVPPEHYQTIFTNLHKSKLAQENSKHSNWSRILVEKPFGNNLETAQALDRSLSTLFKEDQIFRIDHYLAKEAVQNILSFRFANSILCSAWDHKSIKEISIKMHEEIDVESRGNFYDNIGALRDVGQNHLLQLLALITMDEPKTFTAQDIRSERAKILKKLICVRKKDISSHVTRGQYEGYLNTQGVASDSNTETFFALTAYLNAPKWRGVPIHIEAGKAMSSAEVSIEVLFHKVTSGPFQTKECQVNGNKVRLTISPEQTMHITLNAKQPGHGYQLEPRTLSFVCNTNREEINAYEKVLLDCIVGDQTLFTQTDEVVASWKFITSIVDNWHDIPVLQYQPGEGMSANHIIK